MHLVNWAGEWDREDNGGKVQIVVQDMTTVEQTAKGYISRFSHFSIAVMQSWSTNICRRSRFAVYERFLVSIGPYARLSSYVRFPTGIIART